MSGGNRGPVGPNITASLRHILRRQKNLTVLMGEVERIVPDDRCVQLADGWTLGFEALLLSSGAAHA